MQSNIHPKSIETKVVCSCGEEFSVPSTLGKDYLQIEVCGKCHPFYTGKQKIVDTAGRVDKFKRKYESMGSLSSTSKHQSKANKADKADKADKE